MRTYIVVPILYQERDAGALCALAARVALELVFGCGDIIDQLAVREAPSGQRVDDGGALRIVLLDGLEDGQAGKRGRHSNKRGRTRAGGEDSGRVPCERARQEVACPHGSGRAQDQRIRFQMQGVGQRQSTAVVWGYSAGVLAALLKLARSLSAH